MARTLSVGFNLNPKTLLASTGKVWVGSGPVVMAGPPAQTINGIAAERLFPWNPGMTSVGGIPNRQTVSATVSPSGGDDTANIQAAVNACPPGQVVALSAGTFLINSGFIQISKGITLRGAGAGSTILSKTNGAAPRTTTVVANTTTTGGPLNNKIFAPVAPAPPDVNPIILVGNSRFGGPDNTTSQNLTVDGVQGQSTVTIANPAGFAVGQWVLLDETSNWVLKSEPAGFSPAGVSVKAGDQVVFQMHSPTQGVDDPPDAFGWFSRGYPSGQSSPNDTDGRMISEIKEIEAINGNTITFTTPLSIGYRVSHRAQLTRYTATGNQGNGATQVSNAGVESMTLKGASNGCVRFEIASYCWAKNLEITQWLQEGIAIDNCFKIEVRGCYIHTGSDPTPGGNGYAISFAFGSSECLIENNISRDTNKVMVVRSCGAGSVAAYNYMDDGWISYNTGWQEIGLNASHMAGPHHFLFEGNYSFNMDTDYTHGSSQYITFLNNYTTGQRASWTVADGPARCAGVSAWAQKFTFVGNVLGRPNQMAGWVYVDPMMGCDVNGSNCVGNVTGQWQNNGQTGDVWQIGIDLTNQFNMDAETQYALSTVQRDGNYDYLTKSVHWHNTPATFTIPQSLYLTSKPAFFGTLTWPWVTATGSSQLFTCPAKARYDAGTPFAPAPGATDL